MLNTLAWVFGVVLTLVGILGFVPGLTSNDMLLGIFMVGGLHNLIHLVTGLAALAAAWGMYGSRMYFQVFGVIYAIVTIVGFVQGNTVLGLISVNLMDNLLHLVIAAVALYAGFTMKEDSMASSAPMGMGATM